MTRASRLLCALVVGTVLASGLTACSAGPVASPSRPPGELAYVANGAGLAVPGNSLAVVDTTTGAILPPIMTGTRTSTTASLPTALAATPAGRQLLVADKGSDVLGVIDTATGKEVGRVAVGLEPDAVAVTPNGSLALVANFLSGTVTPVSLPSLRPGTPIQVGTEPVAIAVNPSGTLALVVSFGDGTMTPVALPSLRAGAPIAVGSEPDAVAVTPDGSTALVADLQSGSVVPVSLPSLQVGVPIAVAGDPTGIAVAPSSGGTGGSPASSTVGAPGSATTRPAGGTAYVTGGDAVTPIALAGLQAGSPLTVGVGAEAIALGPSGAHAWVCGADGTLIELDLTSGHVRHRVAIGGQPVAVVIPPRRSAPGSRP
jgi:YVTN family beta-propeller protein